MLKKCSGEIWHLLNHCPRRLPRPRQLCTLPHAALSWQDSKSITGILSWLNFTAGSWSNYEDWVRTIISVQTIFLLANFIVESNNFKTMPGTARFPDFQLCFMLVFHCKEAEEKKEDSGHTVISTQAIFLEPYNGCCDYMSERPFPFNSSASVKTFRKTTRTRISPVCCWLYCWKPRARLLKMMRWTGREEGRDAASTV